MDRIAALNDVLTQNPNDAFARYGLAMEYSKQGDFDRSLAEFSSCSRPVPTTLLATSWPPKPWRAPTESPKPKTMLTDGIASARRTGNLHAQGEMEAMLAELGNS